ncbi:MAG TPA: hypothetical protein VEI05_01025 [Burkholderiaceae bacterium]|nr:hypothetical protein [Burkholderiaceae bacterium]
MASFPLSGIAQGVLGLESTGAGTSARAADGSGREAPAGAAGGGHANPTMGTESASGAEASGTPAGKDAPASQVPQAGQTSSPIGTQMVLVFDDQTHSMTVKLLDIETQKVEQSPAYEMASAGSEAKLPTQLGRGTLINTKA